MQPFHLSHQRDSHHFGKSAPEVRAKCDKLFQISATFVMFPVFFGIIFAGVMNPTNPPSEYSHSRSPLLLCLNRFALKTIVKDEGIIAALVETHFSFTPSQFQDSVALTTIPANQTRKKLPLQFYQEPLHDQKVIMFKFRSPLSGKKLPLSGIQ